MAGLAGRLAIVRWLSVRPFVYIVFCNAASFAVYSNVLKSRLLAVLFAVCV